MTARALLGFVFWTALCLGIWLLSLSAFSWSELVVGGLCAVGCALAAVALQRGLGWQWSFRRVPVKPLLALPAAIVSDAAQTLVRPVMPAKKRPRVRTVDLEARGRTPAATIRRAALTLAITSTPGTVVLDVDERTGVLTFHSLEGTGPRIEETVAPG